MSNILINLYSDKYRNDVQKICYSTGYMGGDLSDKGVFNDKELFYYLFINYYLDYEKKNCFIAIDSDNDNAIGYIVGALDTKKQEIHFFIKLIPKILVHLFTITIFKYPESFKALLVFLKTIPSKINMNDVYKNYPSHLHINILKEYQHLGVGSMLIDRFERHLESSGSIGLHLRTTDCNYKAVPFYLKKNYILLHKRVMTLWKQEGEISELIFAKELKGDKADE